MLAVAPTLQHLDSSPNQYIQWRYGIGEDREALEKVNLKVNEDEEKKMAEKQVRPRKSPPSLHVTDAQVHAPPPIAATGVK